MTKTTGALAALALLAMPATAGAATPGWDAQGAFRPAAGQTAKGGINLKQAGGTLTVRARVTGLVPGSHHALTLNQGDCLSSTAGPVVATLPDLVAGADGVASVRTTVPTTVDLVENKYYLAAFSGFGATPGDPITCANVWEFRNNAVAPVVQTGTSGVSGLVRFWQRGNVLKGLITLHGLVPGSTHAMHIHVGSCAVQGGIVQPLPDATANAAGVIRTAVKLTTFEDAVGAGYYFNLHQAASPTFGGGIACGDLQPASHIFAKPKPVAKVTTTKTTVKKHGTVVKVKKVVVHKGKKKVVVIKKKTEKEQKTGHAHA